MKKNRHTLLPRSLPMAFYAGLSIVIGIIILLVVGNWSAQKIYKVEKNVLANQEVIARQELKDAMFDMSNEVFKYSDRAMSWDEVAQQLANPRFYSYWHKNRLFSSGYFPEHFQYVELYGEDGEVLGKSSEHVLPQMIDKNLGTIKITKRDDIVYLQYGFAIPGRQSLNSVSGYVMLAIDLQKVLEEMYRFKYADLNTWQIDIKNNEIIDLATLVSNINVMALPNTGILAYNKAITEATTSIVIAFLLVMGLLWFLYIFMAGRPLQHLMSHLQALHSSAGEYPRSNMKLPITELLQVESSLTEYHKQLQINTRELRRFRSAMDSSPDHMFIIDLKTMRFVDINEAAAKELGYSRRELLSMGPHDIKPSMSADSLRESFSNIVKKGGDGVIKTIHQRKDGSVYPVEVFVHSMSLEGEEVIVAVARDITERENAEHALLRARDELEKRVSERTKELKTAKEEAEHANTEKSRFLSQMSHELRTPLNAIIGFSQILGMGGNERLSNNQLEMTHEIYQSGMHLLALINEILDLASIEAGKIELNITVIDLQAVINNCLTMIRPLIETENIRIDFEPLADEVLINADETRCKQVVINLLSNAVKYNHENGSVRIQCLPEVNGFVRLEVIDTGKGIGADHQKLLFEPFIRLDSNKMIEGTGIGLTVTRQLIDLMHGNIGVKSELGKGSTFWVEFPEARKGAKTINTEYKMPDLSIS